MSEYFERAKVVELIREVKNQVSEDSETMIADYEDGLIESINKAQTVDVAPVVHGRWTWTGSVVFWKCSVCECEGYENFKFCPLCGAKMDESGGNGEHE